MKGLVWLSLVVSLLTISCKKDNNEKQTPQVVKTAFEKLYPDVKNAEWDTEGGNYEAGFRMNNLKYSVLFDAQGKLLKTESEINASELPQAIKDYVASNYPGKQIKGATRVVDAQDKISYEAEIDGRYLIFDAQGSFLKFEDD